MQELLSRYQHKCSELLCEPISLLEAILNDDIASGRTGTCLQLNGSAKELFNKRIDYVQLSALCEALIDDTSIEYLDLSYNNSSPAAQHGNVAVATFGDRGAAAVARLLRRNKTLKVVILEGNAIGPDGALELAAALTDRSAGADAGAGSAGASGLEVLNLAANPIGDKGAEALAAMLEANATLRMLDLGGCELGVKGVLALTSSLAERNRRLETLGLDDCALRSPPQDTTPRHLARMLAMNPCLKQIYLSKQGIRDFDLEVLVDYGLTKTRSIEVLDLRSNRLSPMAATHLARLLHENSSIKVLDLSYNRISDDGAVAIAEALPLNRSLQELDLRCCSINDSGLVLLAQALALNTSVTKVLLWGNGFGLQSCRAWRDLLLSGLAKDQMLVTDIEPYEADGVPMVALVGDVA